MDSRWTRKHLMSGAEAAAGMVRVSPSIEEESMTRPDDRERADERKG